MLKGRPEVCKRTVECCHLHIWLNANSSVVAWGREPRAIMGNPLSIPLHEHMQQWKWSPSNRTCCFFSQPICLQYCEYLSIMILKHTYFSTARCQDTSQNFIWYLSEEMMIGSMLQEKLSNFVDLFEVIQICILYILSALWELSRGMFYLTQVPPYKKTFRSLLCVGCSSTL